MEAVIALWIALPITFYCLYIVMNWLCDEWNW